jgi:hypothetical protein
MREGSLGYAAAAVCSVTVCPRRSSWAIRRLVVRSCCCARARARARGVQPPRARLHRLARGRPALPRLSLIIPPWSAANGRHSGTGRCSSCSSSRGCGSRRPASSPRSTCSSASCPTGASTTCCTLRPSKFDRPRVIPIGDGLGRGLPNTSCSRSLSRQSAASRPATPPELSATGYRATEPTPAAPSVAMSQPFFVSSFGTHIRRSVVCDLRTNSHHRAGASASHRFQ